jgi:DNA-binding NtrC family response regulator
LLRVLQERTFERVGGNTPVKVDVRVIAATNRDLQHEVAVGTFRDDLFYRLNVIDIPMPPLRERKDDIPLLVNHFLAKRRQRGAGQPRIAESAMEQLLEYDWPGNVRQLENAIERAVLLAQGGLIGPEHLLLTETLPTDQTLTAALEKLLAQDGGLESMLSDLRQRLITLAIERNHGDRTAAARSLKIDESKLSSSA